MSEDKLNDMMLIKTKANVIFKTDTSKVITCDRKVAETRALLILRCFPRQSARIKRTSDCTNAC